jgi:hypothetical protein
MIAYSTVNHEIEISLSITEKEINAFDVGDAI